MKLSEELTARGFVGQFSAESLADIVDAEKRVIYHGIDPSADSAHVGNFVIWMLLRHLINHGHTVVFLVGGGTGMIGDPKPDQERNLVSFEEVQGRVEKLRTQAQYILGGQPIEFINNFDWLGSLNLLTFLRDIGKHFTVNELVKKDAIARRLESEIGLSYTEFAYPLLQAYDYLNLHRLKGCTLQVGGSDQWGNIVAGVDLVRRVEKVSVHALTVPLIVDKTTGKKFGKSEGNAVWLDAEKTSPYEFYQFWLNVADENVVDYLKLFTFVSLHDIDQVAADLEANPGKREAQKMLAREVTTLVHGSLLCEQATKVSACLFGEVHVADLSPAEQETLRRNAPVSALPSGTDVLESLVVSGLASSKREARTFIESGAVSVHNQKISDANYVLTVEQDGGLVHLRRGKRQVALIVLS
jgi:tyrosyl-tRNA synthetase